MFNHGLVPLVLELHDLVEADGVTDGDDTVVVQLAPSLGRVRVEGLAPRRVDVPPRDSHGTFVHALRSGMLAPAGERDARGGGGGGGGGGRDEDERGDEERAP
jgi:hypothetical protein